MKFVHRITWGKSGPNGPKVENIPSAIALAVDFDYVMYFEPKSSMASLVLLKNESKMPFWALFVKINSNFHCTELPLPRIVMGAFWYTQIGVWAHF